MNTKNLLLAGLIGGLISTALSNIPIIQFCELPAVRRFLGGSPVCGLVLQTPDRLGHAGAGRCHRARGGSFSRGIRFHPRPGRVGRLAGTDAELRQIPASGSEHRNTSTRHRFRPVRPGGRRR